MWPPFSPHSPQAQSIAAVFSLVLVIAAVIFLVVVAGVVYSVIRYRSRGLAAEPRQIFGSRKLEILWTVVPLAIVTGLFIVTVRAMVLIDAPQDSSQSSGHRDHGSSMVVGGALSKRRHRYLGYPHSHVAPAAGAH